ncbi:MAG: hypothetical protein WA826_07625, partial [Silvibacterium sp.]
TYRENTRQILGERWGRKFVIGQRVRVLLERVDTVQKRLQFSILDEDSDVAVQTARAARPQPTKGGKKKARDKRGKLSMQRQGGGKPHPFPKKKRKTKRRK